MVASDMVRYEERKKRNGWYDEVKVEEQNKARIKMLRRMKRNTENYKNK
jgi:hypothetical protein